MIDDRQFIRSNFHGVYLNGGSFYGGNAGGQRAELFALLYDCKFRYTYSAAYFLHISFLKKEKEKKDISHQIVVA